MSTANAANFFTGNRFTTTLLTGSVQVQCPGTGANRTVNFQCRLSLLDPVERDFFIGPVGVTANQVMLISKLETGDIRTTSSAYNSISNRSVEKINLWITGLLQKPLLAIGLNEVSYKMFNAGQLVNEGKFSVTVIRNSPMSCPHRSYVSEEPYDCESQFSMCERYFSDSNYCQ